MDIGNNIKVIRESKRITQVEIAEALKVDNSYYAKLEKRGNKLTFEQVEKIADYLGITLSDIVNYDPGKNLVEPQNHSERIVELRVRVTELEDRVRDKEELIKLKNSELRFLKKYISGFYLSVFNTYAFIHELCHVRYEENGKEIIRRFSYKEDINILFREDTGFLAFTLEDMNAIAEGLNSDPLWEYVNEFIRAESDVEERAYALSKFKEEIENISEYYDESFKKEDIES